jgi:hypothetical protein
MIGNDGNTWLHAVFGDMLKERTGWSCGPLILVRHQHPLARSLQEDLLVTRRKQGVTISELCVSRVSDDSKHEAVLAYRTPALQEAVLAQRERYSRGRRVGQQGEWLSRILDQISDTGERWH